MIVSFIGSAGRAVNLEARFRHGRVILRDLKGTSPPSRWAPDVVLVAVRGGDLVSLFKIFQISVPVLVTTWRVPFVKSSRRTQGSRYRIASLLMRLNYLATAEGSRTNRLCNCTKFPT